MIDQHASLGEKFIKKGFWLYLFSFIIAPIGYIVKIILSSDLSVSDIGVLYGIISLITMISAFNDLGMTESMNKFIPKYITEKRYDKVKTILIYSLLTQITTGVIIASFFFFGADFIALRYFENIQASSILKIFAFFFLGINILQVIQTFFLSIQNTFYNRITEFVRMGFILLFIIGVHQSSFASIVVYSYGWLLGLFIGVVISIILFYRKYFQKYLSSEKTIWSKSFFREIFSYAIIVFLGAQAATILGQMDMQMIIYILGTEDAGYYTNYLSIIGIPFLIIGPIFSLLFPIFSEMYSKKEFSKIQTVKEIFQKNFIIIGIWFNTLFFIFAKSITIILFGEKFLYSSTILQYSILFLIFNFLLQINFNILAAIGKVKERLKIVSIAICFNFLFNLLFIYLLGAKGAALATGLGWILIWILSEITIRKDFKVQIFHISLLKNILSVSVIGGFFYYFGVYLLDDFSRVGQLFFLILISIVWFFLATLINKKEFLQFVHEVRKIKTKKLSGTQ